MKVYGLTIFSLALAASLLLQGCNKKQDILNSQMETIQRWLNSRDPDGELYTEISSGVFRNIQSPENGQETPVAQRGDSVYVMYGIYAFSAGFSGSRNELIFTNKADLMPERVTWPKDTLKIAVGDGRLMKGVENSLPGSAPGDVVTVILTSSNAYGDHTVEQLAPNTPIAWILDIDRVIKKED